MTDEILIVWYFSRCLSEFGKYSSYTSVLEFLLLRKSSSVEILRVYIRFKKILVKCLLTQGLEQDLSIMCDVNHVFVDQPQNKDYQSFDLFEI